MKSYLSLIPISAKVRRRQNRMTVFCIVIAVFLVTAVFSMADMGIRMEKQHAIEQHGNWHFRLRGVSAEDAEQLAQQREVAAASRYDAINYKINEDYFIGSRGSVSAAGTKPSSPRFSIILRGGNSQRRRTNSC